MGLVWNWENKCGEAVIEQANRNGEWKEFHVSLYRGNAFLIFVYEFVEDGVEKYTVRDFWADERHAKNCLGLNPKEGYKESIYADREQWERFKKFRINKAKYSDVGKLVSLLARGLDNIEIEVYTE